MKNRVWLLGAMLMALSFAEGLWGCAYDRELPEHADVMSFFELSLIGNSFFYPDFSQHSRAYGMRVKERVQRPDYPQDDANEMEWQAGLKKITGREWTLGQVKAMLAVTDSLPLPSTAMFSDSHPAGKLPSLLLYLDYCAAVNKLISQEIDPEGDRWETAEIRWASEDKAGQAKRREALRKSRELARTRAKAKELGSFLRAKYAFQAVRLGVVLRDEAGAIADHQGLSAPLGGDGYTRYRSLGYAAMAQFRLKRDAEAFRSYVLIFDQCPSMRRLAVHSMSTLWNRERALEHARTLKNPHQRAAALYAIQFFEWDESDAVFLEEIPALVPKEPLAAASLLRLLQSVETGKMLRDRHGLLGIPKSPAGKDYERHVAACEKAAGLPEVRRPELWLEAGAYFALLDGDRDRAGQLIQAAVQLRPKDPDLLAQLHLLETLAQLPAQRAPFDAPFQDRIAKDLKWAAGLKQPSNNPGLWHSLWLLLGQKCLLDGERMRAAMYIEAGTGLADPQREDGWHSSYIWEDHLRYLLDAASDDADLARLGSILAKGGETPLDKAAMPYLRMKPADVQLIRAVKAIRVEEYSRAVSLLKEVPKDYFMVGKPLWYNGTYYAGSRLVARKSFVFETQLPFVREFLPKETSLAGYADLMDNLQKRLAEPGLGRKERQRLRFRKAVILATRSTTGWPEIRKLEQNDDELYTFRTDDQVYPFALPPISADLARRSGAFLATMKLQNEEAARILMEDAKDPADPELAAKGLAAAHLWSHEDSEADQHPPASSLLAAKFRDTAFYQDYRRDCELLKELEPKPRPKKNKAVVPAAAQP